MAIFNLPGISGISGRGSYNKLIFSEKIFSQLGISDG